MAGYTPYPTPDPFAKPAAPTPYAMQTPMSMQPGFQQQFGNPMSAQGSPEQDPMMAALAQAMAKRRKKMPGGGGLPPASQPPPSMGM